jgi:hypothetical protein
MFASLELVVDFESNLSLVVQRFRRIVQCQRVRLATGLCGNDLDRAGELFRSVVGLRTEPDQQTKEQVYRRNRTDDLFCGRQTPDLCQRQI